MCVRLSSTKNLTRPPGVKCYPLRDLPAEAWCKAIPSVLKEIVLGCQTTHSWYAFGEIAPGEHCWLNSPPGLPGQAVTFPQPPWSHFYSGSMTPICSPCCIVTLCDWGVCQSVSNSVQDNPHLGAYLTILKYVTSCRRDGILVCEINDFYDGHCKTLM